MRFWAGTGVTTADEVDGEAIRDRRLVVEEEATMAAAEVIVIDLL